MILFEKIGRIGVLSLVGRGGCLGLLLFVLCADAVCADEQIPGGPEPEIHSLFPLGGSQASSVEVEVRGMALSRARAAWFSGGDGLVAKVLSDSPNDDRVLLRVTIHRRARAGPHALRLVTPRGVSNVLYFHVHSEPVIAEAKGSEKPHDPAGQAQEISVPVVVNGAITRQGERDYYAFDATRGEDLSFEIILSREALQKGFRPQLILHDPTGSWFDQQQFTRLAFHSEVVESDTPITSGLTWRFGKSGRYILELGSERHKGAPDYAYELRVVPADARYRRYARLPASVARVFTRRLVEDRLSNLWSRAVAPNRQSPAERQPLSGTLEQEPNDDPEQAMEVTVPTLIEGVIAHPGDLDRFTFTLEDDQRLAFEIETPDVIPPHFNPRLEITDSVGRSMLTNVVRVDRAKSGRWYFKRLEPKIIQTFEQGGKYALEVRDVTSRAGSSGFRYRLLIRRQIPHVGQTRVAILKRGFEDDRIDPDLLNLMPGEAKSLTVETHIEEIGADVVERDGTRRFTHGAAELALLVENLPPGVRSYVGGFIENTGFSDRETARLHSLLPDVQKATIVLQADEDAPATVMPQPIRVVARPLIDGRPATRIVAGVLPVMVGESRGTTTTRTGEISRDDVRTKPDLKTRHKPRTVAVRSVHDGDNTVRSLRLVPESLRLQGKEASRHFLVLAQYADGVERDITGQSRIAISRKGLVHVAEGGVNEAGAGRAGRVTAIADGELELTAEFSGKTVATRVVVEKTSWTRPFSFARDIGGILTKHGCNSVECHGSVKGKGGFKLSTGAVFPKTDFQWIVKGGTYHVMTPTTGEAPPVPRINLDDPGQSLLLLKASGAVPHGGEQRLMRDGSDYATMRRWIENGAPYGEDDEQNAVRIERVDVSPQEVVLESFAPHRLLVNAHLANGQQDDLTDQVHYTSNNPQVAEVTDDGLVTAKDAGEADIIVRAAGHIATARIGVVARLIPDYPELESRNFIDEHIFARTRRFHILPSRASTDAEFLRRVCLDVTGTLPPPTRVREFLASDDPDKRDKLIEVLLESPEYVEFWTYRFSELFRVYSGATLNAEHARLHENWIRNNIARNKPYDQVARERISAQGYNSPAWHYWTFRDLTPAPEIATEQFRVFTGRRLGCAQCHDHPFESWSQDQFWGIAAFFGNMTRIAEIPGMRGPYFVIDDPAGHGLRTDGRGKLLHPRTKLAAQPTFLDGKVLPVDRRIDLRMRLAEWMTSPENPFFAEAIVNRIWAHYLGRGIVDPVDDFRTDNPPSHPELLAALATDFVEHGFDLKHLMRIILQSRTWQLSGTPNPSNRTDETNYARAYARLLEPPVLLDAISQVTGIDSELVASGDENATSGVPARMRAINVLPNDTPCPFFDAYIRNDRRGVPEDKPQLSVLRSLHRLVGPTYTKRFVGSRGRLDELLAKKATDREIIEDLYLAAVSRFPTDREQRELQRLIADQPSRRLGLESLTWALINAREFVYNH